MLRNLSFDQLWSGTEVNLAGDMWQGYFKTPWSEPTSHFCIENFCLQARWHD